MTLAGNPTMNTPHVVGLRSIDQDGSERNRVEETLRQSEEKSRAPFNSIDEGFSLIDVIFDSENRPADLFSIEANDKEMQP